MTNDIHIQRFFKNGKRQFDGVRYSPSISSRSLSSHAQQAPLSQQQPEKLKQVPTANKTIK